MVDMKGLINWIKRQCELLRYKKDLIENNYALQDLLNFKIEQILPKIEVLDQEKLYYVYLDTPESLISFQEYYAKLRLKMKWTPPIIFSGNIKLNELPEEKLQELLRKVRANKIKK